MDKRQSWGHSTVHQVSFMQFRRVRWLWNDFASRSKRGDSVRTEFPFFWSVLEVVVVLVVLKGRTR